MADAADPLEREDVGEHGVRAPENDDRAAGLRDGNRACDEDRRAENEGDGGRDRQIRKKRGADCEQRRVRPERADRAVHHRVGSGPDLEERPDAARQHDENRRDIPSRVEQIDHADQRSDAQAMDIRVRQEGDAEPVCHGPPVAMPMQRSDGEEQQDRERVRSGNDCVFVPKEVTEGNQQPRESRERRDEENERCRRRGDSDVKNMLAEVRRTTPGHWNQQEIPQPGCTAVPKQLKQFAAAGVARSQPRIRLIAPGLVMQSDEADDADVHHECGDGDCAWERLVGCQPHWRSMRDEG